jgi:SAM-dependent methyltransferase
VPIQDDLTTDARRAGMLRKRAYELAVSDDVSKSTQPQDSDQFWDAQPCGGFRSFDERASARYRRDPWLLHGLAAIAGHSDIVEIGCGQGTDALTICRLMQAGGRYRAFDHSQESLASARSALEEVRGRLSVVPELARANALRLPINDGNVECVYSCGVIHHIDDTEGALAEIWRILRPGGHCRIAIYRTVSPKVAAAHVLRGAQRIIDRITGRKNSVLRILEGLSWDMPDGTTMVRECFGVPILKSYTERAVRRLFADFHVNRITPHGYLWLIEAEKP